ncbi:hypothetical protein [Pararhizobium sp. DWP3-4]|uniref:hypothetical protein n=1 Tax=Pararhizobium sp. DWP3-4 TaxID=2804565 RepID=UPI003CEC5C3E
MVTVVVQALRSMADDAFENGNAPLAANAVSIAYSIIGCSTERSDTHVEAASLLLEQGMHFMQAYEHPASDRKLFH